MRFAQACAVALPTALLLVAGPAAAQGKRFDGNWSVEVVTQAGACDRAYRYAMVVENGVATIRANVDAFHDVGLVDFFINGAPATTARTSPFTLRSTSRNKLPSSRSGVASIDQYSTPFGSGWPRADPARLA